MEPLRHDRNIKVLLIGPYDPLCGEYTFLAPPLGVWRIAGTLRAHGIDTHVFDPNCCELRVTAALEATLRSRNWDVIGFSTTGMTLRHDLSLAHFARRLAPGTCLVAGGMEATFRPERLFELGPPFDLIVLGEGEKPLLQLVARLQRGASLDGIPGTALRTNDGKVVRFHQPAMTHSELCEAIGYTPYESMPYRKYWERLEEAYEIGRLPFKADREARLAEIRAVRLITLNYCPMACSFCSSTNFLREAQGSVPGVARLDTSECLTMLERIVSIHSDVRTVIFQDDIFALTRDERVLPLCDAILDAKARGRLPRELQFISTNRIDAMSFDRLEAMRRAGFRVLGFGIENFSRGVLAEFNKSQIHRHIDPVLSAALRLGITPFLDLILTSPGSTLADLAENVRQASRWLAAGCEVGIYPYVIPFSGAAMARDATFAQHTVYETVGVPGTDLVWRQATKILPADPQTRNTILEIEEQFEMASAWHARRGGHLPSRVRSVLWLEAARRVLSDGGEACDNRLEALVASA
ncbi:MAG TPA: radical SAM protein [Steroidobacteraceae bacterium]|nr:radical SAM protein [Steroidobacteraceae bacterium]